MANSKSFSLDDLYAAVSGSAAALKCTTELQPAGGPGATVMPPTFEGGKYAKEQRRVPGKDAPVDCVLLDSVQSQANRVELALLRAWQDERLPLPVITVDFGKEDLPKSLRITSLEAPHRLADALLRDSLLDGQMFRESPLGKQLDDAEPANATALFQHCPTALVLGMWDSTGPKGGLGAKFQRAIVSEIVGIDIVVGAKTSSRLDPAQIPLSAGPLYQAKDGGWTLDEKLAAKDKKTKAPIKLGKDGKPSEANHGNVTPSIAEGGVTMAYALHTTVLSLAALRRLRFPLQGQGRSKREVDDAARTALAALGLCGAVLARYDYNLRSRCDLFPTGPITWELLDRPGSEPRTFELDDETATKLYRTAVGRAKEAGLPWQEDEVVLRPSPQLAELVRRSQQLAAAQGVGGEEGD